VGDHAPFPGHRASRLDDVRRLQTQVSEEDLARLLDLTGAEDVVDLGSGTGFYTDRVAALTTGTVYAVELQAEMNDAYRERGVPANVKLVLGDITALSLAPASADVALSISTWHEVEGGFDLPGLVRIVRPPGKLVVIDWRRDTESWDHGPPAGIRSTKEEVAGALSPYFDPVSAEDLGRFMFAVVARRKVRATS
jgi:SAM-dependent methyltransferase